MGNPFHNRLPPLVSLRSLLNLHMVKLNPFHNRLPPLVSLLSPLNLHTVNHHPLHILHPCRPPLTPPHQLQCPPWEIQWADLHRFQQEEEVLPLEWHLPLEWQWEEGNQLCIDKQLLNPHPC